MYSVEEVVVMICVNGLSRRMKSYEMGYVFLTVIFHKHEVLELSCNTCSLLLLPNLLHLEACASLHPLEYNINNDYSYS